MQNRLIILFICIVSLFFIVSLSRSIYSLWQKGNAVDERVELRESLKAETEELRKQLGETESAEFVEKQARDKLNLQRPGEVVVVLPEFDAYRPLPTPEAQSSNWQKWQRLLF